MLNFITECFYDTICLGRVIRTVSSGAKTRKLRTFAPETLTEIMTSGSPNTIAAPIRPEKLTR